MDLKLHLMLRVALLALLCLIGASAYLLVEASRDSRLAARDSAERAARMVEVQTLSAQAGYPWPTQSIDLGRFLDFGVMAGQCVRYVDARGAMVQSNCQGWANTDTGVPAWFAAAYHRLFGAGEEVRRPLTHRGRSAGAVIVVPDADLEIDYAWRQLRTLLGFASIVVLLLCALVYVAIDRALAPTRQILAVLESMRRGDLSARLPPLKLDELRRISEAFNQLAEGLERSVVERDGLMRRLVTVQEEERHTLARELHDEFGQCLAAIGAVAASINCIAGERCPEIVPEVERIQRTTRRMMELLRGMLLRLRPPDIVQLGIVRSLARLIDDWNGRSAGATSIELKINGDFEGLPAAVNESIFRIVQESLTNVAKHAGASQVQVCLARSPSAGVEVQIEDDGCGCDARDMAHPGWGLLGMRERVATLGGRLTLQTGQVSGSVVHAFIPLVSSDAVTNHGGA